MARRARAQGPALDEKRFRTADETFRHKYRDQLQEHRQELRDLGLDPDLIGEHEVDPVMCSHCGEPIPWRVLLGIRN
jgi:hypothetical protein